MALTCITVVIVSYQSAALTVEALRSVLQEKQTQKNLDIKAVVVDNAAGDTPALQEAVGAKRWGDWVTLLTAPRNGGFGYGNNCGFEYALSHWKVDYFHILNPDTQVKPGGIKVLADFLNADADVGVVGSSFETQNGKPWPYAFRFPSALSEFEAKAEFGPITKLLKNKMVAVTMGDQAEQMDWVSGASMLIRSELVEQLRGFDESFFLYFEETDLCQRVKRAGYTTWYVPESRVMHILGQSTKVGEETEQPKRLPTYWFESRTNYFLKNHGLFKTLVIDVATVLGLMLAGVKRFVKRVFLNKKEAGVPYYIRDIIANSAWFPKNAQKKPFSSLLVSTKV